MMGLDILLLIGIGNFFVGIVALILSFLFRGKAKLMREGDVTAKSANKKRMAHKEIAKGGILLGLGMIITSFGLENYQWIEQVITTMTEFFAESHPLVWFVISPGVLMMLVGALLICYWAIKALMEL